MLIYLQLHQVIANTDSIRLLKYNVPNFYYSLLKIKAGAPARLVD